SSRFFHFHTFPLSFPTRRSSDLPLLREAILLRYNRMFHNLFCVHCSKYAQYCFRQACCIFHSEPPAHKSFLRDPSITFLPQKLRSEEHTSELQWPSRMPSYA